MSDDYRGFEHESNAAKLWQRAYLIALRNGNIGDAVSIADWAVKHYRVRIGEGLARSEDR